MHIPIEAPVLEDTIAEDPITKDLVVEDPIIKKPITEELVPTKTNHKDGSKVFHGFGPLVSSYAVH